MLCVSWLCGHPGLQWDWEVSSLWQLTLGILPLKGRSDTG